jgi:GT2 family glycosyltransferase
LLLYIPKKIGAEKPLLKLYECLDRLTEPLLSIAQSEEKLSYPLWSAKFDTPSRDILAKLAATINPGSQAFIIARFKEASEQYAEELAIRLVNNIGQAWQAVFLFSPGCNSKTTIQTILQRINADSRITFTFPQLVPDSEFVVFIEGGALPRAHALRTFTDALRQQPSATMAYSDEDQFNNETPSNPWFKPQFSPLLARQAVLLGRMLAFRSGIYSTPELLAYLADTKTEPAAFLRNYAIALGEERITHIPHVLYHDTLSTPRLPLSLPLPENLPIVSIIIPTRDRWDLLGPCLESIKTTAWPTGNLEIIVVDNGSTDAMCLTMLEKATEQKLIRVIRNDTPFNWSRLNNLAVLEARGSLLLFLNNDTEVLDKAWLQKLAVHALQPGTGAVGCKLLYPDQTVQHGGVIIGIQKAAVHAHSHLKAYEGGYRDLAITSHEILAVTGACLAVTRANYEAVGGFNEQFQTVFNDIIFCLDLHTLGKRNVYVADPLLFHYESKSRGYDDTPEKLANSLSEAQKMWCLHPKLMQTDPYYSPNLSIWTPYVLSLAPRRQAIWDDTEPSRR